MTSTNESVAKTKTSSTSLLDDQLVDMAFITNFTGMTDKWFYRLISEARFPAPIKLGRSSRWRRSQVEAWLLERIKLSED
ncbi:AlpA family phage regulatory protein [Citrobacter sp. CK197]|uniref:helix-turn-helix transcriptional regulator n=1 Tax=Citrobacter sp. CK197 TaxID=2985106 RepID=UPI0025753696|nr:AlpA family phage regulatory protein [Citrobacter sp. CK197]MDM2982872.1 AlpA family phage regulatory protein [Citrobacter sp. CK197]